MIRPCAIFDLDGTLAHTAPDLIGAVNELMADDGFPPMPVTVAEVTAGFGGKALLRKSFELAERPVDEARIDALYHPFLEVYRRRIADDSHLYDGVLETLDALEAADWLLGICTNKPEALALDLLERLDVLHRFGSMVGADTLPVRKPDPVHLFESIERCGGTRGATIMIGDTDTDLNTARAAGVPCIMTTFGYSSVPVATLKPDAQIDHFSELAPMLTAMAAGAR